MQTPIQKLITHLEMLKSKVDMVDIDSIIEYATNKLEEEKEHVMNAFKEGYDNCGEITSIEYYNQTFNQNK